MEWTGLHGHLLGRAFEQVLGQAERGAVAFVRCLTPDVVAGLAEDRSFDPQGWKVLRVADLDDAQVRTITADGAVERRETKGGAILLLVDTDLAGAGMDGIYSASREVHEETLFQAALRLAGAEVTRRSSGSRRRYAERAIRKAERLGGRQSVSPWTKFDFLCRVAAYGQPPGAWLHLLGLWPIAESGESDAAEELNHSQRFVERLLGTAASGLTIPARIESLKLAEPTGRQRQDLDRFLHEAETRPLLHALEILAGKEHLWVGRLRIESSRQIHAIELSSWRNRNRKIAKWSGLVVEAEGTDADPPILILKPGAELSGDYSKLEVKWKARPANLKKNAVDYRVAIVTDMGDELAEREVSHSARREEKCRFSNDDFSSLDEDSIVPAKVVVSVVGNDAVSRDESEEFIIRFGQPPAKEARAGGRTVRTFSDGLIELGDRESVTAVSENPGAATSAAKDFVLLRTMAGSRPKSFRVSRPKLIHEVERHWTARGGPIGHWRVRVRASGQWAGRPRFVPFEGGDGPIYKRAAAASRRMAERFGAGGGGVAQVYDDRAKAFDTAKAYVLAWTALLNAGDPSLAICNTVEVQSLAGRTLGLIVLPAHPLRVAWLAAYDNLVLHAAFHEGQAVKAVRAEFGALDGALFPAFLPNPHGTAFVFADTLGFHAVGMVPDDDTEPKAAVAILARALDNGDSADTAATVGARSAEILGNEILKYLDCHDTSRLLQVHALRAGDGLTVARSLGLVHKHFSESTDDRAEGNAPDSDESSKRTPVFSLDLYPSVQQRGIAGRFIADARRKRRSGAGVVSPEDRWMLESLSLPGGVHLPRLRWARKPAQDPRSAAHLAVAFDNFESRVASEVRKAPASSPIRAFGLLAFYQRDYASAPSPVWRSSIPAAKDGEKHPSERGHTERLDRLDLAIRNAVVRRLGSGNGVPVLRTEVSPEKADSLRELHRHCDWVITLDRNAGIEYFDSPRDNKAIYDAYVIDCVPEREDLGCLQLITSTSNLEEVRSLLDGALDQMGLSRSRRNAEFLLGHLKSLSGRLAIRLTGNKPPTSELIALAVAHASCRTAAEGGGCWTPLDDGFVVPVDDVRDLLPLLKPDDDKNQVGARPDLIYVSTMPRKGLIFRFVEVKYRRHLRTARAPGILRRIKRQTESFRKRWCDWFSNDEEKVCSSFRAVRRAKLARVLRFYADKARRHHLSARRHHEIVFEIDRMIEKGRDYAFHSGEVGDRGWVFCPEYAAHRPMKISPDHWHTIEVYLFGPSLLPDSDFRHDAIPTERADRTTAARSSNADDERSRPDSSGDNATLENGDASGGTTVDVAPSVCFGTNSFTRAEVRWPLTVKGNPHLLIAGLPGMGKTTCLLNLCRQMLAANICPIVFSYHQDIDERLEQLVDSLRFIDFDGLGFNPLQVIDRKSRMAYLDVAGAVRDIFTAIYPELGDIQANRIRRAIKESFTEAGWDDLSDPSNAQEPPFHRFVEILRGDPKPDLGLRRLLSRLEELEDYGFFDLGKSQSSLWESKQPIVIRTHRTQNDSLQRAFASLVFYRLYKDMFIRGIQDRVTHAVIFDEAHRAAGLKLIPTMAKECRKYGVSLVLASQEARDFNVSVFSAIANYLVLRLTDADARSLVRNVSSSQRERALIDKIKQMDKFKALYFCEGKSRPYPVSLSP